MTTDLNLLDQLSQSRRRILELLKDRGRLTTAQLAAALDVSHEGVRKQLLELVRDGFVQSDCGDEEAEIAPGRPPVNYCLTVTGDHFFPKNYSDLAALLLDAATESDGGENDILERVMQKRLGRIRSRKNDNIETLRDTYVRDDPFVDIGRDGNDDVVVERNCPYLAVALERPQICSTTVSLMRTILGVEVVREERFQDGDGRCTFRAMSDRPVSARRRGRFEIEPPKSGVRRP